LVLKHPDSQGRNVKHCPALRGAGRLGLRRNIDRKRRRLAAKAVTAAGCVRSVWLRAHPLARPLPYQAVGGGWVEPKNTARPTGETAGPKLRQTGRADPPYLGAGTEAGPGHEGLDRLVRENARAERKKLPLRG
jgi:hypothetical protein